MAVREFAIANALDLESESSVSSRSTVAGHPQNSCTSLASSSKTDTVRSTYPKILTLDVGGRKFRVYADVLIAESGFFYRQLSDRFCWKPEPDGSYFLDTDPELFEHLLRFMRRPSIFPLFWSIDQGFDYHLYLRLQAEAEYFQMDALHEWIKDQKYLNAVIICTHKPQSRELKDITQERFKGNISEDWQYVPRVRKIYICPRKIDVHYGEPKKCGRACHNYQGDSDTQYDEENYLEVVSMKKEILFDDEVCQTA